MQEDLHKRLRAPELGPCVCSQVRRLARKLSSLTTIQLVLNEGRAIEQKQRFYKAVADGLHRRLALRREDVFISLVEVTKENRSFGNGEAHYVTTPQ